MLAKLERLFWSKRSLCVRDVCVCVSVLLVSVRVSAVYECVCAAYVCVCVHVCVRAGCNGMSAGV